MQTITTRFPGKCGICGGTINQGDVINYDPYGPKGRKAFHPACIAAQHNQKGAAHAAKPEDISVEQALANLEAKAIEFPHEAEPETRTEHYQFPRLLAAVKAGCNVWLAGPAGSGKTTGAERAAAALGIPFSFDGALDTEYKLTGFVDAGGRIVSTAFKRAYTEGGLHLLDECDGSAPSALLAINAALANGFAAFPDGMAKRHPDFRCVAAANTWGLGATYDYVGRAKLDAAFLDRFVRLDWGYDEILERTIAPNKEWCQLVQSARARAKAAGLKIIISPRATLNGSALLAAGLPLSDVIEMTIGAGLRDEDKAALGLTS